MRAGLPENSRTPTTRRDLDADPVQLSGRPARSQDAAALGNESLLIDEMVERIRAEHAIETRVNPTQSVGRPVECRYKSPAAKTQPAFRDIRRQERPRFRESGGAYE